MSRSSGGAGQAHRAPALESRAFIPWSRRSNWRRRSLSTASTAFRNCPARARRPGAVRKPSSYDPPRSQVPAQVAGAATPGAWRSGRRNRAHRTRPVAIDPPTTRPASPWPSPLLGRLRARKRPRPSQGEGRRRRSRRRPPRWTMPTPVLDRLALAGTERISLSDGSSCLIASVSCGSPPPRRCQRPSGRRCTERRRTYHARLPSGSHVCATRRVIIGSRRAAAAPVRASSSCWTMRFGRVEPRHRRRAVKLSKASARSCSRIPTSARA